jgi:hypothetical protein
MRFTLFDVVLTIAMLGLLIWRLWYGEKIGEDRLDRHVQRLFPEEDDENSE